MLVSVVIITKNEEKNIGRCLNSVDWADEILVIDSGSTDKTRDICNKFSKCKFIETDWLGFGRTKQYGVEMASYDWVLSLDADEEVSTELAQSIRSLKQDSSITAFKIRRSSFYLSKMINFSGWQNDSPLRFFNKKFANFDEKIVHEKVSIFQGECSYLDSNILHYPYPDIETHIQKINLYTTLQAKETSNKNKKFLLFRALISSIFKFIKMYILRYGFLDGKEGFILALLSGFYVFLKYVKLWATKKGK